MSRRNDTPVPEFQNARKALKRQEAATPAEVLKHEATKPWPPPAEVIQREYEPEFVDPRPPFPRPIGASPPAPIPPPLPAAPPAVLGRFATKAELDAVMLKYEGNGVCPLCRVRIGRGIHGHISKCLRSQNSKPESTTTS